MKRKQEQPCPQDKRGHAVLPREGWVKVHCPDGRRGLWIRVQPTRAGRPSTLELCAGREGCDAYFKVSLRVEQFRDAVYIVETFQYAKEVAAENRANARRRTK